MAFVQRTQGISAGVLVELTAMPMILLQREWNVVTLKCPRRDLVFVRFGVVLTPVLGLASTVEL